MVEIDFSYIYDLENDDSIWAELLEEFNSQYGVKVRTRRMTWDSAWAELFSYTSTALGKGPHVSHIGNTWVGSLARMNALRAFKSHEIAAMGGTSQFIPANWNSGMMAGDPRIWAIPWTAWIYVICYRKDLLGKAGIDPAGAFGATSAVKDTVKRLAGSSLEVPWLNPQSLISPRDLMHIAASWIWAAGGDFLDRDGSRILFNTSQSLQGWKDWLEIYRAVPLAYRGLAQHEIVDMFRQGRAAAILANVLSANTFVREDNPIVRDNLGVASVTDIPWIGGGSFVIWDHVRGIPQEERAALDLVTFLASKAVNVRYSQAVKSMPSRIDAIQEVYPEGDPAREAIMLAAMKGQGYHTDAIWRRIEYQLSEAIGTVMVEATKDVSVDLDALLHKHLDLLAKRLNVTLEG